MTTASQSGVADGTQVLASLRHRGIDIGQAEANDVVVWVPFAVSVIAEHPAGSAAVADRVALVPDKHRRQLAVEYQVAGIQVIPEHPAVKSLLENWA
jgi:hypothetical protein